MALANPSISIWKIRNTRTIQHRIVWWLVDVGAAGHVLNHGWQIECARQLGVHRVTIYRQVELMLDLRILFEGPKKGEIILNTDIFKPAAETKRIKKERI